MTELSLREQLSAAFAGGDEPAPAAAAPEPPVVAEAATAEPEAQDPAEKPLGARDRDESGRFAPKAGEAPAEPISEPATAAEANPPSEEPIRVPPSLPAALKAKFKELSPEWREAFTKRDEDVNTAKAQWDTKAARLNRLDEIIAPHKDAWAVQGLDDHQALTRLVAAEKVLRETPAQGILYLAQSYGVDIRQLVGQAGQPTTAPAPQVDPMLQQALDRIKTFEDTLAQQTQSQTDAQMASAQAQINEFASKPENIYFDNVKDDVAERLGSGRAKTLQEAYEQAVWASPEIRPLLLQEQTAAAAKKAAEDAARAKAKEAKNASGSVTGSPTPGAGPVNAGPRPSLREELLASAQEAGVRL